VPSKTSKPSWRAYEHALTPGNSTAGTALGLPSTCRLSAGEVADGDWLRFSFPAQWHYECCAAWTTSSLRSASQIPASLKPCPCCGGLLVSILADRLRTDACKHRANERRSLRAAVS
jgi:hypothetical protein